MFATIFFTTEDISEIFVQTPVYLGALSALIHMLLSELIIHDFNEAEVVDSLQEPTPSKGLMQTTGHILDL